MQKSQTLQYKHGTASTGNASIDHFLGGGIHTGSLLLVEYCGCHIIPDILEASFAKIAEDKGDNLLIASYDLDMSWFSQEKEETLIGHDKISGTREESIENKQLNIAWRYQNKSLKDENAFMGSTAQKTGQSGMSDMKIQTFSPDKGCFDSRKNYISLLAAIKANIEDRKLDNMKQKYFGVSLKCLNTPLWMDNYQQDVLNFRKFLLALRKILRSSRTCCLLSVSKEFLKENDLHLVHRCCDAVLQLIGSSGNPFLQKNNGYAYIKKNCLPYSITGVDIDTDDLAFKVKKKTLIIEKIYLGPENDEKVNTKDSRNENKQNKSGCGNITW